MNVGLYRGAAAMAANERRLEVIASNLANVRATGFKRAAAVHHAQRSAKRAPDHTHVKTALALDWSQGRLERTGAPTDLALLGAGFFAVETPQGERYTRDGHFNVDQDGTLVTQEGFPVAWDSARGRIDPLGEPLTVDRTGEIHQGQRRVGRVKTIDFAGKSRMRIDSHGYYVADASMAQGRAEGEVHQGALEESNVSPVDEMVSMIQTQRSYEAGSTVMQLISQTYRRLNDFR